MTEPAQENDPGFSGPVGALAAGMRVWTARLGIYRGRDALDVTRSNRDELGVAFAPSWRILRPVLEARRKGLFTETLWHDYEVDFLDEMRGSWESHRAAWLRVFKRREVTLLCMCTDSHHCHRTLLAQRVFPRFGASYEGERTPAPVVRSLW